MKNPKNHPQPKIISNLKNHPRPKIIIDNPQKYPQPKTTFTFIDFLRDKLYLLILAVIIWLIAVLFLIAFKLPPEPIIALSLLGWLFVFATLATEYLRRRKFYKNFLENLSALDRAYLVLETLEQPNFYDGKIFYDALYEINKSMNENIKKYQTSSKEFQEYIEMWIHEVKTPLATLTLLSKDPKIAEQIKRLDDYVEQILFLSRAENAERDYIVGQVSLAKVIGEVANRNRQTLLARQIDFIVENVDSKVYTDGKWLEFILNQIITNSIKYQSRQIIISATDNAKTVTLSIRDNGIGIDAKDLPRVFEKTFTGSNGHANGKKSTGMGLYIAKTLCEKLGHQITITSEKDQYTLVEITFAKNNYYTPVTD